MRVPVFLLTAVCVVGARTGSNELARDPSDEPLYLTPFLDKGEADEGRRLARNPPLVGDVVSYSGLLTVNGTEGMNLFFWFFPAESPTGSEPVMVWLQGGPGASSMFGALVEHGPYQLLTDGRLLLRRYRWTKHVNLLYIDNPVGVGFSTTDGHIPTDQLQVGHYLHSAVDQFFRLFPTLRNRPFYVSGESYGGKYVPALAYAIHRRNDINLAGIVIGNGLVDPVNMMVYPQHQYQLGLIDKAQREDMETRCQEIVDDIHSGKWYEAGEGFREMFWNSKTQPPNLLTNNTGFTFHYNILVSRDDGTTKALNEFMSRPDVKRALHVGSLPFQDGSSAEAALHDDMMKSVLPWFVVLAENYDVLLYSGQLDLIIPHPTTASFLEKMKWSAAEAYDEAVKTIWRVGGDIAGYAKTVQHAKNGRSLRFVDLLVRSAGHIVPQDQPKWAFHMISKFISGEVF